MKTKDLKGYLDTLKKSMPDEIAVVDKAVKTKFEVPAVIARLASLNRYPAVMFNNVSGYKMPMVSNLFASRQRLALALGCETKDLHEVYRGREDNRIEPKLVKSGPVKQVIKTKGQIDVTELPIVTHNEKDAGPYITAGAMVAKDPETGIRNIGVYRHILHNKKQIGVHLAETSHSSLVYDKHARMGKPMEVAITIGAHPIFYLGVLSFVPYGIDEYTVVGGLMEEPLEVVKCETVDLEVPAQAEIVIEGVIDPNKQQKPDGPFGEYTSIYGRQIMNPVIDITAITMRKNPIYLDILSGHLDHQLLGGVPRLGSIFKTVKMACPTVKDVYMPPSGFCRFICYVSIEKRHEGEAKNVACAVFAADPFIKYAIVVDPDIDIFNDSDVWKAIAGRVRAREDCFLVDGAKGHPLDPTSRNGFLVGKVGIDATKPLKDYPETVTVPGYKDINLDDYIK